MESIKTISENTRLGITTSVENVSIDFTTTRTELTESIDVLKRTNKNGGVSEEVSVVTPNGEVIRGESGPPVKFGDPMAGATAPEVPGNDNTLIHSHPTALLKNGTNYQGYDALIPSGSDRTTFMGYARNIIVGALGHVQEEVSSGEPRIQGAAFFGRHVKLGDKPAAVLSASSINKILKQ